jgi:hypothetical protein
MYAVVSLDNKMLKDVFSKSGRHINADYSQSGRTVVSALEDLKYWRGHWGVL